ncbi:MAG TPA: helix-turn-helix domain-containing protein [Fibrobacteria bacterium]|nr:helix-turn-helix domain-containing protein [Fibrobacteria bacterium]HOX50934.1 helix-turn-helix domain-containing protein [Fibrobacteria bacterium]
MKHTSIDANDDRRVRRTRDNLQAAFMELLHERTWEEIRVQDICDRANVGRSTFYNHYVDKEGLIVGGLTELGQGITAQFGGKPDVPVFWFARPLLDHVLEGEELFRKLKGTDAEAVLKFRFGQLAVDLARRCLVQRGVQGHRLEAGAYFVGGAFMELLGWYVHAHRRPSLDKLEAMFHEMADGAVRLEA